MHNSMCGNIIVLYVSNNRVRFNSLYLRMMNAMAVATWSDRVVLSSAPCELFSHLIWLQIRTTRTFKSLDHIVRQLPDTWFDSSKQNSKQRTSAGFTGLRTIKVVEIVSGTDLLWANVALTVRWTTARFYTKLWKKLFLVWFIVKNYWQLFNQFVTISMVPSYFTNAI